MPYRALSFLVRAGCGYEWPQEQAKNDDEDDNLAGLLLVRFSERLDIVGADIDVVVPVSFCGKSHVHGFVAGNTANP